MCGCENAKSGPFGECQASSWGVSVAKDAPSGQVGSQVRYAQSVCEGLESVVSDLELRLSAVLSPNCGWKNKKDEPKQVLVPFAWEIKNIGDRVSDSIARLRNIISWIEL